MAVSNLGVHSSSPCTQRKAVRHQFLWGGSPSLYCRLPGGLVGFPHVVELMVGFAPQESTTLLTAKYYLDFTVKFILAIGVGFVLPVFLVLLNFAGVLSAKGILKGWRWAVLSITIFTAMATPAADVLSMFILAIPMLGLYFVAAGVATIHDKRAERKQAQVLGEFA